MKPRDTVNLIIQTILVFIKSENTSSVCAMNFLWIFLFFGCEESNMIRSITITPEGDVTRHLGRTDFKVSVKVTHDERDEDGNAVRINVLQPVAPPPFNVEKPEPKTIAPTITDGTVKNGDYVNAEVINSAAKIEVTFSEQVRGHIALQTFGGDDVGWLGKVEGNKGILELVSGKEINNGTLYMIVCVIRDTAGNRTTIKTVFHTTGIKRSAVEDPVIPEEPEVSFKNDILPIFKAHCQRCHRTRPGHTFPMNNLDLTSYEGLMKGARGGRAVVDPGWSKSSWIYWKIHPDQRDTARMPLGKPPLSAEEFQLILDWIDEGAKNN